MANKYHRQSYKGGKLVQKLFENIYKLDTTGKKDKIIKSMNEVLKRKNIKASPSMVDAYDAVMKSDFVKKKGPHFDKLKEKKKDK